MTLDEIAKVDKDLLAARYEAAITEEFGALAEFLDTTIDKMIARSRAASRVIGQMHEIAPEYDFEMELLDLIRRDGDPRRHPQMGYRDQPTRFEWGYNPDALKQQDRWQKFSNGELKSLKQALCTSESVLDEIGLAILRQIEAAISLRGSD